MFQFPAFAPRSLAVCRLHLHGFPHSDMRGSIPVCGSPRLFAAYHVLPRLRKPRHPPFALIHFLCPMNRYLSFLPLKLQLYIYPNSKKLELSIQTLISFCFFTSLSLSILSMNSSRSCGRGTVRIFQKRPQESHKPVPHSPTASSRRVSRLQKGGVPATPSGTATLLRLSPNHQFHPRPLLDGHGLQAPPAFMA